MGREKDRDELEDVESIPREQAEKEMQQAARNVTGKESHRKSSSGTSLDEEEVTPATRQQAKEELHEAVQHVKEEEDGKKQPGRKTT